MSDDANETLLRIEQLLRAFLKSATTQKIEAIRSDRTLSLIYDLTGTTTREEIAKRAKVSTGKVSGIWQSWEDSGLLVKDGKLLKKLV